MQFVGIHKSYIHIKCMYIYIFTCFFICTIYCDEPDEALQMLRTPAWAKTLKLVCLGELTSPYRVYTGFHTRLGSVKGFYRVYIGFT